MKKFIGNSILALSIALSLPSKGWSQDKKVTSSQGEVLTFRGDESRSGRVVNGSSVNAFSNFIWKYQTRGSVRSSPVLYKTDVVIGTFEGLAAIDKVNGNLSWSFKIGSSVNSTFSISKGIAYFTSTANEIVAFDLDARKLKWKTNLGKTLRYDWLFDYYTSSPLVVNGFIYVGSSNGDFVALDLDGKIKWKLSTGASIHSSPAFSDNTVVFGNHDGVVFAADAISGKKKWEFRTEGFNLRNEPEGFDRRAIIGSPAISKNKVIVGGRDGYLYAIDLNTGSRIWSYNYEVSWVVNSVAIQEDVVICGTSDGKKANAFDLNTGKVLWTYNTSAPVFSSPVITGETVIIGENNGVVASLDFKTGQVMDRIRISMDRIFSTAAFDDHNLFIGSDDGFVYAVSTSGKKSPSTNSNRAVYWNPQPMYQPFRFGLDRYIRDYFADNGYTVLDDASFAAFLKSRIDDQNPSVVVLATNLFPSTVINDTTETNNLVLQYLKRGGKLVALAQNPSIYSFKDGNFAGFEYKQSEKVIGFKYPFFDLRTFGGFYQAKVTEAGRKWGLMSDIYGINGLPDIDPTVTPLALTENSGAAAWIKNYGGKEGTGFLQLWITPTTLSNINEFKLAVEYGLK